MAGEFEAMVDLFQCVYLLCMTTNHFVPGGGGPDQAAYNILLNMKSYKDITRFTMSEDGWAAQLGTTGPQVFEKFGDFLVEPIPNIDLGKVYTKNGILFPIVHQYDRVPMLKPVIEGLYKQ